MGGLSRLFSRLIPIITLVCFICLGITTAFNPINKNNNLTYLTKETIQLNNNEELTYYNFDTLSYLNNLKGEELIESLGNTIDTDSYNNNLVKFNQIWEDGYQVGDVSASIVNAGILVVNTILVGLNLIFLPVRLICGLLLVGMSAVGINISQGYVIIPMLKGLAMNLNIPLITPKQNIDQSYDNATTSTRWILDDTLINSVNTTLSIEVNFDITGSTLQGWGYRRIVVKKTIWGNKVVRFYKTPVYISNADNTNLNGPTYITAYRNGTWYISNDITIDPTYLTADQANTILNQLATIGYQVQNRQVEEENNQKLPIEETPTTPIEKSIEEEKKLHYCYA